MSGGAGLEKRPVLSHAIDDLQRLDAGVLVVHRRDRLARDVVVAAIVERVAQRSGARVLVAEGGGNGDGPEAVLLRTMVDAIAQFERSVIRARISAALQVKRRRGQRVGGIPYGWHVASDGVHLVEDDAEQCVVRLVKALRAQGATYSTIAQELVERDLRPRQGGDWYATQLRRIVHYTPAPPRP